MAIAVDALTLNFDHNVWGPQDPNEFNPLRFSPEYKRNPVAFMGFGLGPRNCIGKLDSFLKLNYFKKINFVFYKLLRYEIRFN
jgi:cytochrome P450 family 3 subfamily A